MYKPLIAAIAAVFLGTCVSPAEAQTQKTITFGSSKSAGSKYSKENVRKRRGYGMNSLTFGAISYFDGFTALTYERVLTEDFTIAVGLGATNKNLWMEVGDLTRVENAGARSSNHSGPNQWDIVDDYGDMSHRKAVPGLYFSVSPKYYTGRESLQGNYLAPLFEYRNYRYSAQAAAPGTFETTFSPTSYEKNVPRGQEKIAETVRCLDLSVVWGGHYQLGAHIAFGYHVGLGYRMVDATRLDLGYEEVSPDTYRYTNNTVNYTDTRFIANIGLSLGGWW